MIKVLVPKDKLLEDHAREGWEPLCNWLGERGPEERHAEGQYGSRFSKEGRTNSG